jgi:hypothetical protein
MRGVLALFLLGACLVGAGAAATLRASTSARVWFQPASQVAAVGTNISVNVHASGVADLAAYEVQLQFDPAVLEYRGFTDEGFLTSTGRPAPACLPVKLSETIMLLGCATRGLAISGPSGDGTLMQVQFKAIGAGISSLTIEKAELSSPEGGDAGSGAVQLSTGVVKVVDSEDEANTSPPPPTPTPRAPQPFTVVQPGSSPTPVTSLGLTDSRAQGGPASPNDTGSGTTRPGTGGNMAGSAQGGQASTGADGSPGAGHGQRQQDGGWQQLIIVLLSLGASCAVVGGLLRYRREQRGRQHGGMP